MTTISNEHHTQGDTPREPSHKPGSGNITRHAEDPWRTDVMQA
jgi:hypothetical protein